MIGDTFEKDIYPALASGLHAVWLNIRDDALDDAVDGTIVQIQSLIQLVDS